MVDRDNIGFHFDFEFVKDTVEIWILSNYQSYPFPGGYVDQPKTWHTDRRLYLALRNRSLYIESENRRIEGEAKANIGRRR